jgi:hypothetical protein
LVYIESFYFKYLMKKISFTQASSDLDGTGEIIGFAA